MTGGDKAIIFVKNECWRDEHTLPLIWYKRVCVRARERELLPVEAFLRVRATRAFLGFLESGAQMSC